MKDEALKLALESITKYLSECPDPSEEAVEGLCDAASAARKALAAPVQKRPQNCGTGYCSCVECVMGPTPVQEAAFHGFMDTENCCVHICHTPWAPRMTDGKFATAYYTTPPAAQPALKPLTEIALLGAYEAEQQGRWGDHVRGLRAVEERVLEQNK
jgi:hypothetical protein